MVFPLVKTTLHTKTTSEMLGNKDKHRGRRVGKSVHILLMTEGTEIGNQCFLDSLSRIQTVRCNQMASTRD